ncbi:MAG: hypothetical protein ACJ8C4_01265 [Gemmataceae bacterium]
MKRRLITLGWLAIGSVVFAQSPDDQGRTPAYGGPTTNAAIPQNQQPLGRYPTPNNPATMPQPYRSPRPGLNPYLNLSRGGNGLNAVDYYNFVRPAEQSLGWYSGRQPGPYTPSYRYGGTTLEPEVQVDPSTSLRPAGTPSAFMNTGRYFNSMGTIGAVTQPQQQQQQQRTTAGRR